MINSKQKTVLVLGNTQTTQMQPVIELVQQICEGATVRFCSECDEIPVDSLCPALILICQNWPDEYRPRVMNDLVSRFPLSRLICCYGPWCEADGRTRTIWPLSIRVPARAISSRLQLEWEIIQEKRPAFPLTSGRDEVFQAEASDGQFPVEGLPEAWCFQVESGDRAYRGMLVEKLVFWGGLLTESRDETSDLLVADLDPWEVISQRLQTRDGSIPVVGVMGLAHPETVSIARSAGIENVVSKLAPEQELFQAISSALKLRESLQAEC